MALLDAVDWPTEATLSFIDSHRKFYGYGASIQPANLSGGFGVMSQNGH